MEAIFFLFIMMIGLGFTVFWVLTIVEIVRSEFEPKNDRLIYLLLVILLPLIGSIIYYAIGRQTRVAESDDML